MSPHQLTSTRSEGEHSQISKVVTPVTCSSSVDDQEFGATTSSIEFARSVFGNEGGRNLTDTSLIPGHAGCPPTNQPWNLQLINLPPQEIMQALIDQYFDAYHWYVCLFNEYTFRQLADRLQQTVSSWQRKDMSQVLTMLTVALLGLQSGLIDDSWSGHRLFQTMSIDPTKLLRELCLEVRCHMIDVVEDCSLETVQICLLFATFHVYHDSPNLAWVSTSMAVSAVYAQGMQYAKATSNDPNLQQIRSRCWNHTLVADTFGLVVYGRPGLIDAALLGVHELREIDNSVGDISILNHPLYGQESCPTMVTFHVLKAKLYRIIRRALDRFKVLQQSHQGSCRGIEGTIEAANDIQSVLTQFRSTFPPLFEWENWKHSDPWKHAEDSSASKQCQSTWRKLLLQATMIQVLYNGAVILAHRPLLEYKIPSFGQAKPSRYVLDSLRSSLDTAVNAALSISQTPIHRLEGQFCISFFFMHLFTAGVILCMAPASQPLSPMSQHAKSGIVRIIRACREVGSKIRIAQHTEKLLNELLQVTLQREMDNALKAEASAEITDFLPTRIREADMGNTFSNVENDPSLLPTGDINRSSNDSRLARGADGSYTATQFEVHNATNLGLSGDTLLDVDPAQFNALGFPTNMWPFRGYEDINVNVGGFEESEYDLTHPTATSSFRCITKLIPISVMFNLLPSDGRIMPNSDYTLHN